MKKTSILALGLLAFVGSATAASIQIDTGRSAVLTTSTPSDFWNNLGADTSARPASITDLVDSNNASTGIGVSVTGTGGGSGAGADYFDTYPSAIAGMPTSALSDSLFVSAGTQSLTFSFTGLTDGQDYAMFLYGSRGNSGGNTQFDASIGGLLQATGNIASVFNNATDTVTLNFTGDATGTVDMLMTATVGSGGLNVITLTAIPEPSSAAALLGLGALALVMSRRK
jgi:hypothetical protein